MNKEIKEKWLEALRSGEYKQARSTLRIYDNYCCLGVLCNIYHKETGNGEWKALYEDVFRFYSPNDNERYTLTTDIINWAGLNENVNPRNPIVKYKEQEEFLATLNDNGISFDNLANIIEKEL